MKQWIFIGVLFIFLGIGVFAYYDSFVKPDKEAEALLTEGVLTYERGSKEAVNHAIDLFTQVVSRYPGSKAAPEAFYYMAKSYEQLGLNRLAYLKYVSILKNSKKLKPETEKDIQARLARLKIMKRYDEEGIHQLLGILNMSDDKDFRSRIYTELGHTYLKKGDYSNSKRMFDLALSENGSNEEAILGKARVYKRTGNDGQAYELYDHFLKYYSNFSSYTSDVTGSYQKQLYESGLNSYRRGRYSSAITYFKKYLAQFPSTQRSENSLYWLGESYFSMKDYNTAIAYFQKVQSNSFNHKDQDAQIKTGYAYFLAKNYELASREFQGYIDNYPHGQYINKAKQWKEMSTREMMYRYKNTDTEENGTDES
ncbi:MAG TPA: tetratricopeptide repeat protein, partial [Bacteroidales bacterium]|nr:tetratricopeptide repeat protein [Bacteroidales bacterium]